MQYLLGHSTPAMVPRYSATYNSEKAAQAHAKWSPHKGYWHGRWGRHLGGEDQPVPSYLFRCDPVEAEYCGRVCPTKLAEDHCRSSWPEDSDQFASRLQHSLSSGYQPYCTESLVVTAALPSPHRTLTVGPPVSIFEQGTPSWSDLGRSASDMECRSGKTLARQDCPGGGEDWHYALAPVINETEE